MSVILKCPIAEILSTPARKEIIEGIIKEIVPIIKPVLPELTSELIIKGVEKIVAAASPDVASSALGKMPPFLICAIPS